MYLDMHRITHIYPFVHRTHGDSVFWKRYKWVLKGKRIDGGSLEVIEEFDQRRASAEFTPEEYPNYQYLILDKYDRKGRHVKREWVKHLRPKEPTDAFGEIKKIKDMIQVIKEIYPNVDPLDVLAGYLTSLQAVQEMLKKMAGGQPVKKDVFEGIMEKIAEAVGNSIAFQMMAGNPNLFMNPGAQNMPPNIPPNPQNIPPLTPHEQKHLSGNNEKIENIELDVSKVNPHDLIKEANKALADMCISKTLGGEKCLEVETK